MVVRWAVEPGELPIAELRIEIRRLERERIDPGRMTAEFDGMLLGGGDQAAADATAPEIGVHPEQGDKQPPGIAMADQPGADRAAGGVADCLAQENPEIRVSRIAQERCVVGAQTFIDEFA